MTGLKQKNDAKSNSGANTPMNIDAEESLIGSLVIAPDLLASVRQIIKPNDFYVERNRWIYEAILSLAEQKKAIDFMTVSDALEKAGRIIEVGGPAYVAGLTASVPSYLNADTYARLIEESATRRDLLSLASNIAQLAYSDAITISDVMHRIREGYLSIVEGRISTMPVESRQAGESIQNFIDVLRNTSNSSIRTMIPNLDQATGGLERRTLTVLACRPGMGKTALAWQIARSVARQGLTAIYFSLEMSEVNLWARASCGVAGVRWRDVRSGKATAEQLLRVEEVAIKMARDYGTLWVNDTHNTLETVEREVLKIRPDFIVVDHLRWLRDRDNDEVRRLGMLTARLKEMAKEYNFPVLCLHQLSRGVEARDNKRPTLSDLRESGHIEENADNVLFLYREDYYETEKPENANPLISPAEVLIAKFRDDIMNQRVHLDFYLDKQWFERSASLRTNEPPMLLFENDGPGVVPSPYNKVTQGRSLTEHEKHLLD